MLTSFDLIIFDCDGTLVDSETLNNTACSVVLTEAGLPHYTPEYCLARFMGLAQAKIWALVEQENAMSLPADINQRYIDHVGRNRTQFIRPAMGASDIVEKISLTHKTCIASNGERDNVLGAIAATGLDLFFSSEKIFTAAQVKNPKPAPDLFLYATEQNNCAPGRSLVIEDSAAGVMAGVAAGMTVYGYVGLAHDPEKQSALLREKGAAHVLNHLADLVGASVLPQGHALLI